MSGRPVTGLKIRRGFRLCFSLTITGLTSTPEDYIMLLHK